MASVAAHNPFFVHGNTESAENFVLLSLDFFFFVKDCSEKKAPSHWHISVSSSDCGAFTRHCLWGISHPRLKPGVKHG
jgi:hypothetical protein